jgi:hypothetical protein
MNKLLKIWLAVIGFGGIGLAIATKASFSEIAGCIAFAIAILLIFYTTATFINWVIENIVDRHRYHISDPDKDCGCYRLDRKTGAVQYIEPKTGAMSAKQERGIAEDEERMNREILQ